MVGDALFSNAMWWGHFRLLGGPRKIAVRTGLYVGLVVIAFLLYCRIRIGVPVRISAGPAVYVVGLVQLLMVLVMCSSRLNKAILEDVNVNMIESHRLSPMTGVSAVIGYMIGPNLQVLCLAGVNFVAGLVFCALAGKWQVSWMAAHLYLAFVAVFIWSGAVLTALTMGRKVNVMMILIMLAVFGGWKVLPVVPALGLLFGSEMIAYCYEVITGGGARGVPPGAALSAVVQILVILTCVRASARKFERPDLPAFSEFWAVLLYVGWVAVAVIGLGRAEALSLPFLNFVLPVNMPLVGTIVASLLLLIVPIRSSSILSQKWDMQHRELAGRKPVGPMWIALGLSVLVGGVLVGMATRAEWGRVLEGTVEGRPDIVAQWGWTCGCVLFTALSLAAMYRATCALRIRSLDIAPVAFLVVTWAVFPLLDAFRMAYLDETLPGYEPSATILTACSPAGGLVLVWLGWKASFWIALWVQGMCCAVAVGIYALATRRARARFRVVRSDQGIRGRA